MPAMSEDEARAKWCPFARTAAYGGNGVNRNFEQPHDYALCIASACMAWRWQEQDEWEPDEQIAIPGGGSYTTQPPPRPRGYCGLVGKPPPPSSIWAGIEASETKVYAGPVEKALVGKE